MRVICDVHTCVAQGFCSRQQQKHNGNEARRQSEREQEYSNPRWPLPFCHSEENQLLWTSVHSSKNSNKTTPDEVNPASKISAVSLTKVGSYLAPREMFNLFFLSKELMESLTTEMVVQSAMMSGGRSLTTIKKLMPLMDEGSIHVPSPQRLLRLINAKRCEFCLTNKVSDIRSTFAFAVCWLCQTRNLTETIVKTTKNYQNNRYASDAISDHYRVSAKHYGHHDVGQSRREFSQAMARAQLFGVPVCLA